MKAATRSEKGASAVEMALVAPFLLILLLGIVEFGFVFGQFNEVRHAVREGARFAAVGDRDLNGDSTIDEDDVVTAVCESIGLGNAVIEIELDQSGTAIGDTASVDVTADIQGLSGAPIISAFLPDVLENEATFRLEQPATWATGTHGSVAGGTSAC